MASSATLSVRLTAQRGAFVLDAELDAPPGVTIVFGESGAGKSTTLAAVAGLVTPQAGRVTLGDDVWFDSARGIDRPVHERPVGFVFQSLALFPHLDAIGNVAYGMPRTIAATERRERARRQLEALGVAQLATRKPGTFSGGEAQRVALARAFAREPRVLLLDEPFSALDRELRRALVREVRAFADASGIPVLHVTHHRREARDIGDSLVRLEGGRVVQRGAVSDVLPDED